MSDYIDYFIIGGGITGAGVLRECFLRQIPAVLVDKDDFGAGTSSKSSKLVHGGIRYLENFEFKLVHESCRERYYLTDYIAPNIVCPADFVYPICQNEWWQGVKIRAGLFFYDLCSMSYSLGNYRMMGKKDLYREEGGLSDHVAKAGVFKDCITNDARLVLETIKGSISPRTQVYNHYEIIHHRFEDSVHHIAIQSKFTGNVHEFRAKYVINATGVWSDKTAKSTNLQCDPSIPVKASKGIHIVVPQNKLGNKNNMIVKTKDNRVVFMINIAPNRVLVGTTDDFYDGDLNNVCANKDDVEYLLKEIRYWYPDSAISKKDIISVFAGLRPLIDDGKGKKSSKLSRDFNISVDHKSQTCTVVGGKLTTFRAMAKKLMDAIGDNRGYIFDELTPVCGSMFFNKKHARESMAAQFSPEEIEKLLSVYGSNYRKLTEYAGKYESYFSNKYDLARFSYAMYEESAKTPLDILFRRTWHYLLNPDRGLKDLDLVLIMLKQHYNYSDYAIKEMKKEYQDFVAANTKCLE